MNVIAGFVLMATLALYSTTLYSLVLKERVADQRHSIERHRGLLAEVLDLRADFDALCDYLDVEITHDEQAEVPSEPASELEVPADAPTTVPIEEAPERPGYVRVGKSYVPIEPLHWPERTPQTEPIPAQPPTVPAHQVIADDWQKQQDQIYREAMAAIHGKDQP